MQSGHHHRPPPRPGVPPQSRRTARPRSGRHAGRRSIVWAEGLLGRVESSGQQAYINACRASRVPATQAARPAAEDQPAGHSAESRRTGARAQRQPAGPPGGRRCPPKVVGNDRQGAEWAGLVGAEASKQQDWGEQQGPPPNAAAGPEMETPASSHSGIGGRKLQRHELGLVALVAIAPGSTIPLPCHRRLRWIRTTAAWTGDWQMAIRRIGSR